MTLATIVFHLPLHRQRSLQLEGNTQEAVAAYDQYIGEYMRYLKDEARKHDFNVKTDQADANAPFTIDESSHQSKKAAHDWLETIPNIWNWIP